MLRKTFLHCFNKWCYKKLRQRGEKSFFFFFFFCLAYHIDLHTGKSYFGSFSLSNFCAVGCGDRDLAWGLDISGLLLEVGSGTCLPGSDSQGETYYLWDSGCCVCGWWDLICYVPKSVFQMKFLDWLFHFYWDYFSMWISATTCDVSVL